MNASDTIAVYRKNSVVIDLTVKRSDASYDLTGDTIFFTVKRVFDDDSEDKSALIKIDVTNHVDVANGKSEIRLSPSSTNIKPGTYRYDIKLKTADGSQITLKVGLFKIKNVTTLREEG